MARLFLRFGVAAGGVIATGCFYGALIDWRELQRAYGVFTALHNADLKSLFVAEAQQNIHRINLFADVVWGLLGAIWATLSLIGIAILPKKK